ncbi:MAG TPA: hypothetical protein VGB02_03315 [Pyrinomonadaceae bacterium]|jgi:hypothetical protein
MSQLKPMPATNDEWTIHALNIHGVFFERWCAKTINETPNFRVVSTNYSVEFPLPVNGVRGKESALDIRAEITTHDFLLTLIVECKKNNPDFVDWIFFPTQLYRPRILEAPIIINEPKQKTQIGWEVKNDRTARYFSDIPFTDESRETKGNYQSIPNNSTKTKTSNAAITEAAYQVSLATQAIFFEELENSKKAADIAGLESRPRYSEQVILPVIVTSAKLFVCNFDAGNVDPNTGEIPFEKAELKEHPYLIFDYPLPRHLQYIPHNSLTKRSRYKIESFMQMQIMVVNSAHLQDFLKMIESDAREFRYL